MSVAETQGLSAIGLSVALGIGVLIGIERERRKGRGDDREAAGLRTFAVAALVGALAQSLPAPGLVPIGALLVMTLAALSYWKSRSRDPGLTTELALFATFLIGVQAMIEPMLAAAIGVALAGLLAARDVAHRWATELLSEQELRDGLLLAAASLIVLPLIPDQSLAMAGGINPRSIAALVVLIMALQALGHVALRWLGPRGGITLAGLLSGFVSSTATIASLGSRARAESAHLTTLAAAAGLSGTATWLQALILCAALSPAALPALLPLCLAGALGTTLAAVMPLVHMLRTSPGSFSTGFGSVGERSALRPREALIVALLMAVVAVFAGAAHRQFGEAGLNVSIAVSALVDAHAPIVSLASMQANGGIGLLALKQGMLVAISANTLMRISVAFVSGGGWFALRVAAALLFGLVCAGAAFVFLRSS